MRTPGEALDKTSSAGVNFKVLKRISPNLDKILATAGQTALYNFSKEEMKWVQMDIEGTFFVVENYGQPALQFVILNQKGDNYFEDIGPGFRLEQQTRNGKSFMFYRSMSSVVQGVYFFDPAECPKIGTLLSELLKEQGQQHSQPTPEGAPKTETKNPAAKGNKKEERRKAEAARETAGQPSTAPDNRSRNAKAAEKSGQWTESTPAKAPATNGSRGLDATATQPNQIRTVPVNSASPFMKTFGGKSFGNTATKTAPSQQPIRTAGLPPINHTEVLEALGGLPTNSLLANDPETTDSHTKNLLRTQAPQNTPQGMPGSTAVRKTDSIRQAQTILKPDFFQNILAANKEQEASAPGHERASQSGTSQAADAAKDSASFKPPTSEQQHLRSFFLPKTRPTEKDRNLLASLDLAGKPLVPSAQRLSEPVTSRNLQPISKSKTHDAIRSIIKELAESDLFIDAIVQQMAKRKLLPDA